MCPIERCLHGLLKSTGSGSIALILVLSGAEVGLTSKRGRKYAEARTENIRSNPLGSKQDHFDSIVPDVCSASYIESQR